MNPASVEAARGRPMRARARAMLAAWCVGVLCLAVQAPAMANEAAPASDDPVTEARLMRLGAELRCLVCQNQTIADSNADLAVDLRNQLRDMIRRGETDDQIVGYMTERYGDFVLYRPPLKATTFVLWFGPLVLLVVGVGSLMLILRKRMRMRADQFEPDPDEAEASASEGKSAS